MKKMATWTTQMVVVGMAMQMVVAGRAFAADAGLEFGVQDDLTVNGTEGAIQDADLEVKGYSLFGSTNGLTVPAEFVSGPGTVVIASNLFVNGQLKAGSIDLSGAAMTVSNLTVEGFLHANGDSLSVLKNATMEKSLAIGEALTVTGGGAMGSLNVTGNGVVGGTLGVTGVTTLSSNLVVNSTTDSSDKTTGALVVQGGVGVGKNLNVGGALGVTGNGAVGGSLTVSNVTTLATNMTAVQSAYLATSSGAVGIGNSLPDSNTKLQVTGGTNTDDYVAKFYSGTTIAAWIKKK
jgi:hypothetical protein